MLAEATVVVMLRDETDALEVARLVTDAQPAARVRVAPVRGAAFFADEGSQEVANRWWADVMPGTKRLVWLFAHEEGLAEWLSGVDGEFIVGVQAASQATRYANLARVRATRVLELRDYVAALAVDGATAAPTDALTERAVAQPGTHSRRADAACTPDPFHMLATIDAPVEGGASAPALHEPRRDTSGERARQWPMWLRLVPPRRGGEAQVDDQSLARAMASRAPMIVAIGSRKGGVGKTSHAAGLAIAAGECLDRIGHRAAIVDANVANPDAWGQLSLNEGSATVRQVVNAITSGHEAPLPVHASTPALACFPESRETSEYSRLEVSRFAAFLRSRYTFIVVDMSNRIPDPTGGPEAAVAAYWLQEADVLVLPTASAKQDFNGVLDYLDVPNLPPTVVAYIPARSRRNREHPLARQYLEAIRARSRRLVELPDDGERVRYAVLEGLPVQSVSPRLRVGYRQLAQAVLEAAAVRA